MRQLGTSAPTQPGRKVLSTGADQIVWPNESVRNSGLIVREKSGPQTHSGIISRFRALMPGHSAKTTAQVADFVVLMSWFYFERGGTIRLAMINGRDPATTFRPKRVGLIGFDGVTALNLIAPSDIFAATALDDGYGNRIPCYEVHTIGVFSDRLRTEIGLSFQAQHTLSAAPELDTIIVAGGRGISRHAVSDKIAAWILKRTNETRRLGAIGSGVYALAATGLLNGRDVTAHWRFARELARQFPRVKIDHRKPFAHD